MRSQQQRAGGTPGASESSRSPAAGKVTSTQSLTGGGGDRGGTVPVAYLAGDSAGASIGVIDAEAELISILARLEFMATFVEIGSDRAAIIDELGQLRERIDAIAPGLAPARHELALERLHAAEDAVLAGLQERVVGAA